MTKIVGARIDRRSRSRPHPSFGLVCTSWVSVTRRKFHGAPPLNPAQCRQTDTKEQAIVGDPGAVNRVGKGDPLGYKGGNHPEANALGSSKNSNWCGCFGSFQLTLQWQATGVSIPWVLTDPPFVSSPL